MNHDDNFLMSEDEEQDSFEEQLQFEGEREMPEGLAEGEVHIPEEIPILPVRDTVVFPRTIAPLSVGKQIGRAHV